MNKQKSQKRLLKDGFKKIILFWMHSRTCIETGSKHWLCTQTISTAIDTLYIECPYIYCFIVPKLPVYPHCRCVQSRTLSKMGASLCERPPSSSLPPAQFKAHTLCAYPTTNPPQPHTTPQLHLSFSLLPFFFHGCSQQISDFCRKPGLHRFRPRIHCVQNGGLEGKWCVFFWSNPLIKARLALPM